MSYPGDSTNVYYKEDILVGYRWYDTKKIKPLYAFGYGLSYTDFSYGQLSVDGSIHGKGDTVLVKIPIKNIGKVSGSEVVQLYVKDIKSSVLRPDKELKAFKKVFLRPGEEQTVTFQLDNKAWRFYDENNGWTTEPGDFYVMIGRSSDNIIRKSKLTIR